MDAHSLTRLDFPRIRELVAGYALTELGRTLASTVRPVTREAPVHRWFNQIREMRRVVEQSGLPPFAGISDVRETVRRCAPPLQVGIDDVASIGAALAGTHAIVRYLAALPEDCPELRHLAERIGDFETIAARISVIIDERGRVRDDASAKLSRIRSDIRSANRQIRTTIDRLLHETDTRKLLQYPNYTFHGDRLVFPVRAEYRGRLPGIVHRSSDSGATVYVEPSQAVELNNLISNLRGEEAEEISRLLWELAHEIYINSEAILKTLDALAVLDLIVAKLRFAEGFDARCPELSNEAMLSVREARHPLLVDLFRKRADADDDGGGQVVPISYRLGDDFDLLIITGPNTGGKTVTLKTVGLLSLMVQAGLPVPVGEGSKFGLFKRVLIDVGDEQSMQQSLSTFSAHLKQHMEMLRRASSRVLLLIDELGAGTDPDEGAAIGRAILDDLLRLDARCVVTTHIGALKSYPLTRERAENGCVEFDTETLKPTYHLRIGEAGQSNAIEIATRLGMPQRLIAAARKNLSRRARTLNAALEGAASVKRRAEQARAAAESARLDADRAQSEADNARTALEKQKADFEKWVRQVAHLQAGDPVRVRGFDRNGRVVRVRIDQHRAEIDVGSFTVEVPLGDVLPPETPAPPPRAARPKPAAKVAKPRKSSAKRSAVAQPVAREVAGRERPRKKHSRRRNDHKPPRYQPLSPDQAASLRPGDKVIVKRLHREGRVVRVDAAKGEAVVSAGIFEVEVPFSGLASTKPPKPDPKPKPKPKTRPTTGTTSPAGPQPSPDAPAPNPAPPPSSKPTPNGESTSSRESTPDDGATPGSAATTTP